MQAPSVRRMTGVTDASMGLAACLYFIVGCCGYLVFKDRTSGDLLRNLGAAHVVGLRGAYERSLKICYGLSILGSVPLVIMPFYNIIMPFLAPPFAAQEARWAKSRLSDSEEEEEERVGNKRGLKRIDSSGSCSPSKAGCQSPTASLGLPRGGVLGEASGELSKLEGMPNNTQHAKKMVFVLSVAMSAALWLPNVEFIF
ncbi:hypothetical protein DUNSADRAFT_12202, partial [Dunaliella salina]